ncbi:MAG: MarR family transcriptional regulator [Sphingomonadaceae bacterium]|nr:MarR family transcriptional regulator [Sphingomonadaceae bacterium]
MVADAGAFYARLGIVAPARTASTLRLLADQGPQSVTQIAQRLKQSHPLVITWIRQLAKLGFVSSSVDPADRRRTLVSLTDAGGDEARRMAAALERLGRAYESVLEEAGDDVFGALCRIAERLDKGGLEGELRRDES